MAHRSLLRVLACVVLVLAATPLTAATATVTTVADSGPGSLRQALLDADAGFVDRIEFAIQWGEQTIAPSTPLPPVMRSIVIDARTQPGYSGTPMIALNGGFRTHPHDGLQLAGGEVYGLAIYGFTTGITIGSLGGTIRNCRIGTDLRGTSLVRSDLWSWHAATIGILAQRAARLTIGGPGARDGNQVLSGIHILGGGPASVQGNVFGTDFAYQPVAPLVENHIRIERHDGGPVSIGGEAPNVFSGRGVYVLESSGVDIAGNYFGLSPTGSPLDPRDGVTAHSSRSNVIRNNTFRSEVVITGDSLQNKLLGNRMLSSQDPAIRLGDTWSPSTDRGDTDTGPNGLINSPVITGARTEGNVAQITGTLSTHANRTHRIELFASDHCHYGGYGPGQTYLGAVQVTTDSSGSAAFDYTAPVAAGRTITATATSEEEGTSVFSRCIRVIGEQTFAFRSPETFEIEGRTITIPVVRQFGSDGPASVSYTYRGTAEPYYDFGFPEDFWKPLKFAPGQTVANIVVTLKQDDAMEDNETIILTLENPTDGTSIGSPSSTLIYIVDDDVRAALGLYDTWQEEDDDRMRISYTLHLSSKPARLLTLPYACMGGTATPGVDYVQCSGVVRFAASDWATIYITIIPDRVVEPDEDFLLYVGGFHPKSARITIRDDDGWPAVSVEEISVLEGDADWQAIISVVATEPLYGGVIVSGDFGSTDPDDRDYFYYWIEFVHETKKTFTISIHGDTEVEPDEAISVDVRRWWGNFRIPAPRAHITLLNDDIRFDPMLRRIAAGTTDRLLIELANDSPEDWLFTAASSNPDAVSVPPTVLLRAGAQHAELPVTALVPDQRATIAVTLPQRRGGRTHTVAVQTYTKTILRFTPSRLQLHPGGTATVSVSLDPPAQHAVILGLAAVGPVRIPSTLTIPAGGIGAFQVSASKLGTFTIDAKLPPDHGNEIQPLYGEVVAAPQSPKILGIAPGHGPASGGTEVTLNGEFLRADCNVAFGGSPASAVTFVNAAKMLATTPPHPAGLTNVLLTCGSDSFTLPDGFLYVYEPPHASNVVPFAGTVRGGTFVRVEGSHFDGSCWVFFGSAAAPDVVVRNAEIIDALTPSHRAETVDVTVRCSGGGTSIPAAYTYCDADDPAPLITNITPTAAAPGELVTITGVYFRPSDSVTFDTTAASIVDSAPQKVVVRVPELAPSDVSVHIADASGRRTTLGPRFTVKPARPPRIDAVAPQAVPAGGELALSGDAFRPGFTFELGGHTADIIVLGLDHATVRVSDELEPGSYPLNVRDAAGAIAATGPAVEILADGITITSVNPRCATTDGGIYTTIRGSGFVPGATATWNGAPATAVEVIDARTLRALVPPGNAGRARITVTDPSGRAATLTDGFTYESPFDPHACSGRARAARH